MRPFRISLQSRCIGYSRRRDIHLLIQNAQQLLATPKILQKYSLHFCIQKTSTKMNDVVHSGNMIHHQINSSCYISLGYQKKKNITPETSNQPLQGVHVTRGPQGLTPWRFSPTSHCGRTRSSGMEMSPEPMGGMRESDFDAAKPMAECCQTHGGRSHVWHGYGILINSDLINYQLLINEWTW